jgi:colanic acid/amylovoran biosynthesis glycosyltransferase
MNRSTHTVDRLASQGKNAPSLTVLQRCDRFVARTMNWLYDHLRSVPRYTSLVFCDQLENRGEFPLIEARSRDPEHFSRRLWRCIAGTKHFPTDVRWLHRSHPRLLHSHFGYVAIDDVGLRDFLRVPWLISFYGSDVYESGLKKDWSDKYARVFASADLVLALGPHMASQLQALGCPKQKIAVHPLGVDLESLPTRPRVLEPGTPLRILFAGTFREKKGVEYVIRGAAKARKHGVPLHVTLVGDALSKPGDLQTRESIFREIHRLGMADAVTHHSFMEYQQLVQTALASHVFVAPSVTSANGDAEGTPFVLQQMMATGMPAIATVHSDIPYVFGEHKHLLLPERDANAIARRLEQYATEPDRLLDDGAALRERIRSAFDVRLCSARLAQLYDKLV